MEFEHNYAKQHVSKIPITPVKTVNEYQTIRTSIKSQMYVSVRAGMSPLPGDR